MKHNNLRFEEEFQERGFASQRRYPNEPLLQFLAANYFSLSQTERSHIRILDLGCGSGANLWMIAREGFDAYGIDIAPTGVVLCYEMLKLWNVTAHVDAGDMRDLKFADGFFDAIVDVVSMQHIDFADHAIAYREVMRCLKPGGKFFQWHLGNHSVSFFQSGGKSIDRLTVDNISNINVPLHDNGLTCFFTIPDAYNLLASVGFRGITIENYTRTYHVGMQQIQYLAITAEKQ